MDVESICKKECHDAAEKLNAEMQKANEEVENILKSSKITDEHAIPNRLRDAVTHITVPGNITTIGYSTFDFMSKLSSVVISEGVTSIGDYAFSSCEKLEEI